MLPWGSCDVIAWKLLNQKASRFVEFYSKAVLNNNGRNSTIFFWANSEKYRGGWTRRRKQWVWLNRHQHVSWCLCKSCRPMDTERRAFVVRRWESLIENWTVRNCRLDCEVTYIRINLSHFTFIFYRSKHQLYHGARFVWCCVQASGCIANCFSLHPQHSMLLLNGAFGKQVWNNLLY